MKKLLIPLLIVLAGILLLGFGFLNIGSSEGDLDIEIVKTGTIMPAAHNVYANENALDGKYYLFKAKLTNNTGRKLEDIQVRYRIPNYVEWTELKEIGEMYPGQSGVVRCYPKLPQSVTDKTTESIETAEIEITWDGAKEDDEIEEEFKFKLAGREQFMFTNIPSQEIAGWADVYDNTDLLACFVTPNDPIVQYYTQNVQEKVLKGETASVTKDPKEAVRFLAGIYNATVMSHMVYSGTKGIPASITDVADFSQENRLPRDVITGNTGLCLELSLFYASVLSNAGLDPVIFLVPGHAYPGILLNGQFYAIEATAIGGEGLGSIQSAEKAFKTGQKQLQDFFKYAQMGDPRYKLINIHELNQQGVTPMSLEDDQFLREKVNTITASWTQQNVQPQPQQVVQQNTQSTSRRTGNNNNSTRTTASPYNISIPSGWQVRQNPLPQVPVLTYSALSPDNTISVSVFDVNVSGPNEAMSVIQSSLSNIGQYAQYEIQGNTVNGITSTSNQNFMWVGKLLNTGGGYRLVALGSPESYYGQNSSTINQLFNSIR